MISDTADGPGTDPPAGPRTVIPDVPASIGAPLLPHLVRSVALLAPVIACLVLWGLGTGNSVLDGLGAVGGRRTDFGPVVNSGLSLVGLVGVVFFGVIWTISQFVAVREVIEEDGVLIPGAAEALPAARDSIRVAVDRLGAPVTARLGEVDGNATVRLTNGREQALVIVRPAGPDLRIGWRVWRARSTATLLVELYSGRSGHDVRALESDDCSALRAAVRRAATDGAARVTGEPPVRPDRPAPAPPAAPRSADPGSAAR